MPAYLSQVLIDITHQKLVSSIRKELKRENIVIDLTDVDLGPQDSSQALPSIDARHLHTGYHLHPITTSFGKAQQSASQTNNNGKDVAGSESSQDSVQSANGRTGHLSHEDTNDSSSPSSERLNWDRSFQLCGFDNISNPTPFESSSDVLKGSIAVSQNTKGQLLPTGCCIKTDQEQERNINSSQIQDYGIHSPYSLDSPYYCPSEVDAVLFSDESNNDAFKTRYSPQSPQLGSHTGLQSNTISSTEATVNTDQKTTDINQMSVTPIAPSSPSTPASLGVSPPYSPELAPEQVNKPNSPTSTEILASDTTAHSPGLSTGSFPSSTYTFPISLPSSPTLSDRAELRTCGLDATSLENSPMQTSIGEDPKNDTVEDTVSEEDTQHICLDQFRKLRQCVVGTVSHMVRILLCPHSCFV